MSVIYTGLMIYWAVLWLKKYKHSNKVHIIITVVTIGGK